MRSRPEAGLQGSECTIDIRSPECAVMESCVSARGFLQLHADHLTS